ncbi:hypothetical protein JS533_009055 [Bifidobacterium amazonense]|uniref:Uncharacterized protein n=1 Tax=Bifidobacterium amazonense TaxID=2809027 RepID=A0ABS9VWG7_9BIFI|nr:hypothetical protein [Bifidobacterium amazonense]MCH9276412.1 hypothetical protein [Bifidobacterium amazonense]
MDTKQPHTTALVMHQPAEWLDHYEGTCRTMCGQVLAYGPPSLRRIIDSPDTLKVSCPLCELAMFCEELDPRNYEQGTLF